MKRMTFAKILVNWFVVALILFLINSFTLRSSFFHSVILALLGVTLLIYPVYPKTLELTYDAGKCRRIVRIIAVIQIVLSFYQYL